jgi:GNAT superfamily N-acetyltransferase
VILARWERTVAVSVRTLAAGDAASCDAIMRGLPDWFSYEPGLEDCAKAVRSQSGWVAEEGGQVLGFATWERRTPATAEVTWMAVERGRHHGGVGTAIIEALCADLRERGYSLALAMTSAASKEPPPGPDSYEATRRFWFARGFHPLIELDVWETNFALLMVRPLAHSAG